MKKIKIFSLIVSIIFIVVIIAIIGNRNYKNSNDIKKTLDSDSSLISIMLETEPESGKYERASNTTYAEVINNGYSYNASLSKCNGGSVLNWDRANKTVIYQGTISDNCSIYFDKNPLQPTLADYIINNVYSEDGVGGLYYHDGVGTYKNATLEAGDNSYRYSGANPNNYLCFTEGCSDDQKYRIIGVIDNKVKLIKMTSVGSKVWNSSNVNSWTGSTMETYLNGGYLTSLGVKAKLIDTTTWHIGGFTNAQRNTENAKGIYTLELNSTPTIEGKIGLMYASEYMYAAEPTYWNLVGANSDATKDYRASKGNDWLLSADITWIISRYSDNNAYAFRLTSGGRLGEDNVNLSRAVMPSFSLSSLAKYESGSGTSEDPYIVAPLDSPFHETCNDDSIACTVAKKYAGDGVGGLYYHDGVGTYTNANLEVGDNSYRYAGTDPNNYVCFKEGCTDDEEYRIIGVIDNKVKVIKMTSVGNKAWNSSNVNTWEGSTMETYLNGEYLTSLGAKASLIDTTTWHVGGFTSTQRNNENAKGIYSLELSSNPTIERKIGLMYISDYMYAADPIYWNLVGYYDNDATKDYRASEGNDWIYSSDFPWAISRASNDSFRAYGIYNDWRVYAANGNTNYVTRPTFVLSSTAKFVGGSGTRNDPYIIN